jgi:hypothetical protein
MAMVINRVPDGDAVSVGEARCARVRAEGLQGHPYLVSLLDSQGPNAGRDLADAVHLLCALHGRHPSLIAIAAGKADDPLVKGWLERAEVFFELERNYLLRLTASVGPIPSTPGAAQSEASLVSARHAIETLGMSERGGCALGAAGALIGDWRGIRPLLDRAASRTGVDCPPLDLPSDKDISTVIDHAAANPVTARAMAFGSDQLLLQHRAIFGLLEARVEARGDF